MLHGIVVELYLQQGTKVHLVWAYEKTTDMFQQHTNRGFTAEMVELVQQPPAPPVPTVTTGNCEIITHL